MSASDDRSPVLVLTTFGATANTAALARTLVAERLAACVNILPVMTSVYHWKGGIEESREHQVIMKTTRERVAALEARLREVHPYDVPEFLVIDVDAGSEVYLAWLRDSVNS